MKKETIITAIIFLVVGFFAGYITEAEFNWNAPEKVASSSASTAQAEAPGGGTGEMKLPEGHPSIEDAAIIKSLEDQLAQNPKDSEATLKLANLYYDQRQFDRAAQWYEKELEFDPKNVSVRTDLGTSYFNLGRAKDALREYQESLKIDPTHEPTMFNIIVVNLQGTHDLAAAQAAWDRLHDRNPNYQGLAGLKESLDAAKNAISGSSPMR